MQGRVAERQNVLMVLYEGGQRWQSGGEEPRTVPVSKGVVTTEHACIPSATECEAIREKRLHSLPIFLLVPQSRPLL